jgi:hypothetical protein
LADYGLADGPSAPARGTWLIIFVSGYLFSPDIFDFYQRLKLPVWLAHGTRGRLRRLRQGRTDAGGGRTGGLTVLETGALYRTSSGAKSSSEATMPSSRRCRE